MVVVMALKLLDLGVINEHPQATLAQGPDEPLYGGMVGPRVADEHVIVRLHPVPRLLVCLVWVVRPEPTTAHAS